MSGTEFVSVPSRLYSDEYGTIWRGEPGGPNSKVVGDLIFNDDGEGATIEFMQDLEQPRSLFQLGKFTLASGQKSNLKIECDALTASDWVALAVLAIDRLPRFTEVEGVPTGGLALARFLQPHADVCKEVLGVTPKLLIVDDVYTTGGSMEAQRAGRDAIGLVAFARAPITQPWIQALWQLNG